MSQYIKKSLRTSIVNYVGLFLGGISVLFIQTTFLTESEIGYLRTILSLSLIFVPFLLIGLDNSLIKFYHRFNNTKVEYNQFITLALIIPLILFLIFISSSYIYFEFSNEVNSNLKVFKESFYIITLFLFYNIYYSQIKALYFIEKKILLPNLLSDIFLRSYLVFLVVIYYFNFINFTQLVYIYAFFHLLNLFFLALKLFKSIEFKFSVNLKLFFDKRFKDIYKFSGILLFGSMSGVIVSQLDIIMTGSITNSMANVGIYTVAFFIGSLIELPKRPLLQLIAPDISKYFSTKEEHKVDLLYKKTSLNLFILGILLSLLLWYNVDFIFSTIPNGEVYSAGKYVIFFIALAKLFDLSMGINSEIILYSKLYKWNLLLSPLLVVLTISTNVFFINKYGIIGASIATAITILCYNMFRSVLVYVKLKMTAITIKHLQIILICIPGVFILESINMSNLFLESIVNVTIVFLLIFLPIFLLKISKDLNDLVYILLKAIKR